MHNNVNMFYVTMLYEYLNLTKIHTKICTNENYLLYGNSFNTSLHVHVVLCAQLHADWIEQAIILWMCGAGNVVE